jgi:hypothetical protein
MITPIAFALVALASLQVPTGGVVRGQVKTMGTGTPLRYAVIEVVGAGSAFVVPTDSTGTYVLRGVPAGMRTLRAIHIDHAEHEAEVFISEGKEIALDFELELRPVRLPPVTTRGISLRVNRDTMPVGTAALGPANVRVLESTPGVAEMGLAEMAREIPGNEPPDPSDILYVRGGTADLKLVLLDGAPVYAPFHLGGLINPLDPDLLRRATLFLGGAPARYDGGLSYVMDLETRAGRQNREHAALAADLLSTHLTLEGPIVGGVSYLAGGRAVHGLGAQAFTGGAGSFPYLYADALGRLDVDLGRHGRITTTGFWNRESVRLDSLSGYQSEAIWGNGAGAIRYRGDIGRSAADITVGVGTFRTQLPVGGLRPLMTDGIARRVRVGINLDRPVGDAHLQYGLQFDRLKYEYRAWPRPRTIHDDSLVLQANGAGEVAGAYLDGSWQLSTKLQVRAGMRADIFSLDPKPRLAPRMAATWILTDRASLTLAAGQYRQYVRASGQTLTAIGTVEPDSLRRAPLNVASASHLVLTLDQDLGEGIRLGVESFYKDFRGLPSPEGEHAQASGLDLWVRRANGRLTGWLGYSLAWIWSVDDNAAHRNFAGRHLVSAGLAGPLGNQGGFEMRVAYGAGLPYTAIPEPETPPVFSTLRVRGSDLETNDDVPVVPVSPTDPYLRVDMQVARTFMADVRGFAFALTPYFKVMNALNRRDALFYHFDRNAEAPETRPLAPLPILPILGIEWKF